MSNNNSFKHNFAYYALRAVMLPLSILPYRFVHALGAFLGNIAYYFSPTKLKKITYNNLALAKNLNLSELEIRKIARKSFQNLVIIALEYFRLKTSHQKIDRFVTGRNLKPFRDLLDSGQGVIAVTGHISNWELSFLHHTQTHPGYAVGKPIKNRRLYSFIQSIREMHGGQIISMQNAISEGVKVLKKGFAFSMLNDQSFTSSSYSYPFFGARAWTSPAPALLAYKTKAPIVIATTTRFKGGKYDYHISDPIWPDRKNPLKKELPRLMDLIMKGLESHIAKNPDQWLWQHKRWKQEGFHRVYPQYKSDSILFILPKDEALFKKMSKGMAILPQIYRRSFLTFMIPKKYKGQFKLNNYECLYYENEKELLIRDYRFQLIFDFEQNRKVKKHFLKLGGHRTFNLQDLLCKMPTKEQTSFDARDLFVKVLCLPGTPFH